MANGRRSLFCPRIFDLIILIICAALCVLPFFMFHDDGATAKVVVDGKTVAVIDLKSAPDGEIDASLPDGWRVSVQDHAIGVSAAKCQNQTCVKTGYISHAGQTVVCVPAKLIITISSSESDAQTGVGR